MHTLFENTEEMAAILGRVAENGTDEAHELRISVAGPSAQPTYVRAALAAVKERVAMHDGVLETSAEKGRRTTVVRLPLAVSHA